MVNKIQAGDTCKIAFTAPTYDPAIYTPKILLNDGVNKYEKVGSGSFEITLTASETANYAAGEYAYSIVLFTSTERVTVESGFVKVLEDLAADGSTGKSKYKKTLDAIEATLLGTASQSHKQTSINGRSIERFSPEELIMLRDKFAKLVKQEERELKNGSSNKKIYIRL